MSATACVADGDRCVGVTVLRVGSDERPMNALGETVTQADKHDFHAGNNVVKHPYLNTRVITALDSCAWSCSVGPSDPRTYPHRRIGEYSATVRRLVSSLVSVVSLSRPSASRKVADVRSDGWELNAAALASRAS